MKPTLLLGTRYTLENSGHLPSSSDPFTISPRPDLTQAILWLPKSYQSPSILKNKHKRHPSYSCPQETERLLELSGTAAGV